MMSLDLDLSNLLASYLAQGGCASNLSHISSNNPLPYAGFPSPPNMPTPATLASPAQTPPHQPSTFHNLISTQACKKIAFPAAMNALQQHPSIAPSTQAPATSREMLYRFTQDHHAVSTHAGGLERQISSSHFHHSAVPSATQPFSCQVCGTLVVNLRTSADVAGSMLSVCHACKDQLILDAAQRNRTRLARIMEAPPVANLSQLESPAPRTDSESCSSGSPLQGSPDPLALVRSRSAFGSQLCEHNRRRNRCKECGGSQICVHGRLRSNCKDCGGSQFCEHNRRRNRCKDCGGSQICEHKRRRSICKECMGSQICCHRRRRSRCKDCAANLKPRSAALPGSAAATLSEASGTAPAETPARISIDNLVSPTDSEAGAGNGQ